MENPQTNKPTEEQKAFILRTLEVSMDAGRFPHAQSVFSYLLGLYVADQQELSFNENMAQNYNDGLRLIQDLLSVTSI